MKITQPKQPATLALNAAASGVTVADPGGFYGGGPLTLEQVLALIGAGLSPSAFLLRRYGGGEDTYDLGTPMAASVVADLANASVFSGEMDQDTTIAVTGWLPAGRRSTIAFAITEDGIGGWTPTFDGFTWINGTPDWITTAGTVTHVVAWSDDEGTTIYGAVVGAGGSNGTGIVQAHGNLGSTETIDITDGKTYHWGTLNANCTFTFTTIADTLERWFTLELIEDGTGGWTVTWPGSVVWIGGTTPTHTTTAGTTTIYSFFTRNGGTTWIGGQLGASTGLTVENEGTPLATAGTTLDFVGPLVTASGTGIEKTITITGALDDLIDVTLTTPATADRLRFDGSVWRNSALIWRPVTVFDPTSGLWVPLVDGSGNTIMAEA